MRGAIGGRGDSGGRGEVAVVGEVGEAGVLISLSVEAGVVEQLWTKAKRSPSFLLTPPAVNSRADLLKS